MPFAFNGELSAGCQLVASFLVFTERNGESTQITVEIPPGLLDKAQRASTRTWKPAEDFDDRLGENFHGVPPSSATVQRREISHDRWQRRPGAYYPVHVRSCTRSIDSAVTYKIALFAPVPPYEPSLLTTPQTE
jgi:hypothetical protein